MNKILEIIYNILEIARINSILQFFEKELRKAGSILLLIHNNIETITVHLHRSKINRP